ncbi:MAG: immunity 53 family protein [Planctomycetaceae bacterium]|nr:immunity 53 family protein [Planctomycetaceae bacterium]
MDLLSRLQKWYATQCDGEWEHQSGIQIQTLDNPGWMITINLVGTELHARPFQGISEGVDKGNHPVRPRWIHCSLQNGVWQGASDETQLTRLLEVFLNWAECRE